MLTPAVTNDTGSLAVTWAVKSCAWTMQYIIDMKFVVARLLMLIGVSVAEFAGLLL